MTCTCAAFVCSRCVDELETNLDQVPGVLAGLDAITPRLTLTATYGDRAPGSAAMHAPAPVNMDAVSAGDAVHRWLLGTALRIAQETEALLPSRKPAALAQHLITQLPYLRTQAWALTLNHELDQLLRTCTRQTMTAEAKVFAGRCANDDTDLYAAKGDREARCPTCTATYEVLAWRAHAATAAAYHAGTAAELSRLLAAPEYGYHIPANTITQWASRGKLSRTNPLLDDQDQPVPPLYRLGDILDLNLTRYRDKPLEGRTA